MNAIAEAPRSVMQMIDTAAGKQARATVLKAAQRMGAAHGSFRCSACKGRCDVEVTYKRDGSIKHSKGACLTPGCIAWEG